MVSSSSCSLILPESVVIFKIGVLVLSKNTMFLIANWTSWSLIVWGNLIVFKCPCQILFVSLFAWSDLRLIIRLSCLGLVSSALSIRTDFIVHIKLACLFYGTALPNKESCNLIHTFSFFFILYSYDHLISIIRWFISYINYFAFSGAELI